MFLQANSIEFDNHFILLDLHSPLDHTSLTVNIFIKEEFIQDTWQTIIISDRESLGEIVYEYATIVDSFWFKYPKSIKITKWSKTW